MESSVFTRTVLILLLSSVLIPRAFANNLTWQETVLDPNVGGTLKDAVCDSSGVLHMAFGLNGKLVHAEWSGGAVLYDTLTTAGSNDKADIQVAPNGDVGIFYSSTPDNLVGFARRSGASWSVTVVDSNRSFSLATGFDSSNNPHTIQSTVSGAANYCEDGGAGNWTCTKITADSVWAWEADGLVIDANDTIRGVVNVAGPADFIADKAIVLEAVLPPPALYDTIAGGFQSSLDFRNAPNGDRHLLTSYLNILGVECQISQGRRILSSGGAWISSNIFPPGGHPVNRSPLAMDIDSLSQTHAVYTTSMQFGLCDFCASLCAGGDFSSAPECEEPCVTAGMLRYSQDQGGTWVEELIPSSVGIQAALLDLDGATVPRVLGKRANEVILLTRDLPTGVTAGTASPSTNRLRVAVSPNPSTRVFLFSVSVDRNELKRVMVYDVRGRQVRKLQGNSTATANARAQVSWDGTDASGLPVAKGVYFARFDFGTRTETHKLTVIR